MWQGVRFQVHVNPRRLEFLVELIDVLFGYAEIAHFLAGRFEPTHEARNQEFLHVGFGADRNDDGIGDAVNQLLRQCPRRHMTDIGVFRRDAEDMLKQQPWVDAPVGLAAKA